MGANYDFSGWATRNDLECSDGRTIRKDAFKDNDGMIVPLVWNHQHDNPANVLGHALLENRDEGVYTYCKFNDTENGQIAKAQVKHKDIVSLSIYANHLKQNGRDVIHGSIREVSLVLAGANPGAFIDSVLEHGALADDDAAIIYTGEELQHTVSSPPGEEPVKAEKLKIEEEPEPVVEESEKTEEESEEEPKDIEHADKEGDNMEEKEKTVKDVFDEMTDEQKNVVYAFVGQAIEDAKKGNEGESEMKHNVFDSQENENTEVLSHSDMEAIFNDAKRYGSLKDSVLAHGITNIEYLFPDDKNVDKVPGFITRQPGDWVGKVMSGVHHTPFSRLKSIYADLTEADARAKGYIKGKKKVEEVFGLLKRTTSPTTIYKKQKLERDDVADIVDFDVVSWLKSEMRLMLDEEIARAILIGDGRNAASDDKINESCIRPIWTDDEFYTIDYVIEMSNSATDADKANALIDAAVMAQNDYQGSGTPTLFTTQEWISKMLLLKDLNGHRIYKTMQELATAMMVKEIVPVSVMKNQTREVSGDTRSLCGIIVNLGDYTVGADKGGAVNMFDDFDIDYNAQKYLIEARCSGSLLKPYSAIALEMSFQ